LTARQNQYDSLVREARATLVARRVGYRDEVFKLIHQRSGKRQHASHDEG